MKKYYCDVCGIEFKKDILGHIILDDEQERQNFFRITIEKWDDLGKGYITPELCVDCLIKMLCEKRDHGFEIL